MPYGRDNIGDEAILECVVRILKEISSEIRITVSTDQPDMTSQLLGVRTCPLFGFHEPRWDEDQLDAAIRDHDLILWGGATGLSDYPEYTLQIFERAQKMGKKTAVFCTGMNDRLNPYLYEIQPGVKRILQRLVAIGSFGLVDTIRIRESRRKARAISRIKRFIESTNAVIVRDEETRTNLLAAGIERDDIIVACDPAITIRTFDGETVPEGNAVNCPSRIGICISSQSPVKKSGKLALCLDRIIEEYGADLYMIPMNPLTDRVYMCQLREKMRNRDRFHDYHGSELPSAVTDYAAGMDLIISSRLHLLILATVSLVPVIGISRGSKVDSFLGQLGLESAGSVESPDFNFLLKETGRLLHSGAEYRQNSISVLNEMKARLDLGTRRLEALVTGDQEVEIATA